MKLFQCLKLIVPAALVTLAACSPKIENIGYNNDNPAWQTQLIAGKTTKDDVQALLGSPSTRSTFGTDTWYYISERKETIAFLKPEVVKQDVVKIAFDENGTVRAINDFDLKDGQNFSIVKRITPSEGHTLGFFEQLLGNVGRFNHPTDSSHGVPGTPGSH